MSNESVRPDRGPAAILIEALFGGTPPDLGFQPRANTLAAAEIHKIISNFATNQAFVKAPFSERLVFLEGLALLWHDWGKAAHEIAQAREGQPDFDLLHALFHRREGDYPNSLYWFGSAGKHPSYDPIPSALEGSAFETERKILLPGGTWSPKNFVAEVRSVIDRKSPQRDVLVLVQAAEIRGLAKWILY